MISNLTAVVSNHIPIRPIHLSLSLSLSLLAHPLEGVFGICRRLQTQTKCKCINQKSLQQIFSAMFGLAVKVLNKVTALSYYLLYQCNKVMLSRATPQTQTCLNANHHNVIQITYPTCSEFISLNRRFVVCLPSYS